MAFTDAIFDGQAELAGVTALKLDILVHLDTFLETHEAVGVVVGSFEELLRLMRPTVLVDARMRKREQPEVQRELASLTIGLGPNFIAGKTTDLAIETAWGDDLGKIIDQGPTHQLAGEPRSIEGMGRERLVYAPHEGVFKTNREIGELVQDGEIVGCINTTAIRAPLDGCLRGLTRSGVLVSTGTKIIEVDPRGLEAKITGIGERPNRIAEGVLQAIEHWHNSEATCS
jgi:xanthine dehydrogenase accessory factor